MKLWKTIKLLQMLGLLFLSVSLVSLQADDEIIFHGLVTLKVVRPDTARKVSPYVQSFLRVGKTRDNTRQDRDVAYQLISEDQVLDIGGVLSGDRLHYEFGYKKYGMTQLEGMNLEIDLSKISHDCFLPKKGTMEHELTVQFDNDNRIQHVSFSCPTPRSL